MISRKKDIKALLSEMMDLQEVIEFLYKQSSEKKEINPKLRVKIKSFFDCARAALDYVAKDIADSCDYKGKVYFPIIYDAKKFEAGVAKSTFGKELKKRYPDLYQYLEDLQPHHAPNTWFKDFNDICNTKKHDNLVPQVEIEKKTITLKHNGASLLVGDFSHVKLGKGTRLGLGGALIKDGQIISFDTKALYGDPRISLIKETRTDFSFDGKILTPNLIKKISDNVPKIIGNIYKMLENGST
jgi:hypothetical protein